MGKVQDSSLPSVFPSSLLSADNARFESHLKSRSDAISSAISQLFAQKDTTIPEIPPLQARITHLLSAEKGHLIELERSRLEKEQLEERLENASLRYMMAEKKLDRARSITVAKLERQATAGGRNEFGSGLGGGIDGQGFGKSDATNGQRDNGEHLLEIETARKEAIAALSVKQEQLDRLGAENEKLSSQVTSLTNKLSTLTDDDYAHTELFKYLKFQHEDVIKRINDLEATNVSLREEAEKSQAERTAYRIQLEAESQAAVIEKESLLTQAETDLARIRNARDEVTADLQICKHAQGQEKASIHHIKQLAAAKEERIKALESEVDRLRVHASQSDRPTISTADIDQLPIDELRVKFVNIDRQYSMLSQELSSMGTAYKRASAIASQKIGDASALEEKVQRLTAEKSKADQKYFGAMKAKEAKLQEMRSLRAEKTQSSEIVSQLKDSAESARLLVVTLEKTVAETKEALVSMTKQYRVCQQQAMERGIQVENYKGQVEEFKKSMIAKDASIATISVTQRKAEVEVAESKVRLEETKKSLESWKARGLGNQTGEYEMLRVCCTPIHPSSIHPSVHPFIRPSFVNAKRRENPKTDLVSRTSPSAPSVAKTSKTRPSRHAVMSFAEIVSTRGYNPECASVRIVTRLLAQMIICGLLCSPSLV